MSSHRSNLSTFLGALAVALGGLGFGFASNYFLPAPREARTEPTAPEPPAADQPPARKVGAGKLALLVGVTKYDHLVEGGQLRGPANDVRLLRTTLVERYGFPPENVVCLTEAEGKPESRPTRANIIREFKRLAEDTRAGEQVVVLLAGHGDRQPESDPPDPVAPEQDGTDEIFLPADVKKWAGHPERVPNAITDKELRDWLGAVTAKKAYVWAIFDCCHSASLVREGKEVLRQFAPGALVPEAELAKARARAAKRPAPEPRASANEYLVATFACREFETTPEGPQPADSETAKYHGLFTYHVVSRLEKSAASGAPLTYRELVQRVQTSYLSRPHGSPSPTVDGVGQDRVVLGTEKPVRPKVTLTRVKGGHVVNVGDLHGVTRGSVLRVYSSAGEREKPRVLGHVQVELTRALESVVVAVAHDTMPKPATLPDTGMCEVVSVDYSVAPLRVAIDPTTPSEARALIAGSLRKLTEAEAGRFQLVEDVSTAQFLVRPVEGGLELVGTSGNRPPIAVPNLRSHESLAEHLRTIHRARALIAVGSRLEDERSRGASGPDIKIEVIGHRFAGDPGTVIERPPTGYVFRSGDRVSFRVTNTSQSKRLEVTLLVVDPDYGITAFYPTKTEVLKALEPGKSYATPSGVIAEPFGPEQLVAIVTTPTKNQVDYGLLTQPGVYQRADVSESPLGQLLVHTLHGTGTQRGLKRSELDEQGAGVLSWRHGTGHEEVAELDSQVVGMGLVRHSQEFAMNRRITLLMFVSFLYVGLFSGRTQADDPKAPPATRSRLVAQLGHSNAVYCVAFSTDGKQVLTGGVDKTARLWDVESGRELRTFTGHEGYIRSVAFSPDGKHILTGNGDETARLWDVATGKEIRRFEGHKNEVIPVAFSAEGRWVLTGSVDHTARLWEAATGKEVRRFEGHTSSVFAVGFSPDQRRVLAGGHDKVARLWDADTGKEVRRFEGHSDSVTAVAFSLDGRSILTGSWDRTARLWDTATGKELLKYQGHTDGVSSATFSPDGRFVCTGSLDQSARLWEVATGKEIQRFKGHTGTVHSVACSPDGRSVLTGSADKTARLWDAATGQEIRRFEGRSDPILSVSFSRDGRWVGTGSSDKSARLWDAATGKEARRFEGHTNGIYKVAFSPDGRWLVTGSHGKVARLLEVATGKEIRRFEGHTDVVAKACFSPDGRFVLTGSADKTARLWDAATGKEIRRFEGHDGGILMVAFSPDGLTVLTGSSDGSAWLWEAATGKKIRRFNGHRLSLFEVTDFSPDGRFVISVCGMNYKTEQAAWLWEPGTAKVVRYFEGHLRPLNAVAFSPDGQSVLTGSVDKTARLWEAGTGKELRRLEGHTDVVFAVTFSPDARFILTGSQDGTARLWDKTTGKALCQLVSFRDGSWAVVDPEGRFDSANGGDVEGLHWVVGTEPIALKQLKERYYDPGLLAKYLGHNKEPLREVAAFTEVKLHPEVTAAEIKPGDKTLSIELINRGGGIGRVQVFVNGKELLADARGAKPDANANRSNLTVDLTGAPVIPGKPNRVEVVAWNAEGYLSGRGLIREWTPAGNADPNPPELYIIVCGVSSYADPKLNLRYAAKDAEDMARALELAGQRLFGEKRVHLTLLSTGDHPKAQKPTKENIRKAFASVRKAKPTDLFVVYLAGHGVALKQGGDEYCYLTADARGTDAAALADPAVLNSWAVTSSELVDWIKQIPALKQAMLLDTCAAGAAAAKLLEHRDLSGDQVRALDRLKDRTGFHVLMGCSADRVSYEASQYSQGLLTYSLLQGMAGARLREGEYVDVSGLFQYAADEVPQLARGIGGVQKPLIIAPRGTSFDIGRLLAADCKALPLAKPKPLILRPLFSNVEDGDDNLKLASLVRKRLADDKLLAPRGPALVAVYVDADELDGAVRPAGTYTIEGKTVSLRLVLKRDGQTLTKTTVDGSVDDLAGLTAKIVEAIQQGTKSPRSPGLW